MPFTTVMMASAMPAAIRPYSIAVAPDSSARNSARWPAGTDRHRETLRQSLHVSRSAHRLHLRAPIHPALTALPNFASTSFP